MAENPVGSDLVVPGGGFKSWFGKPDSGWLALSNQNSWTGTLTYRRIGKIVQLRGTAAGGALNSVIATLPAGFRPGRLVQRFVPQSGTNGSDPNNGPCLIQTDGTFVVNTLTNPILTGVRFLADDIVNQVAGRQTPPMVGTDEVAGPPGSGFEDWFAVEDTGWIDATPLLINSWTAVNTPMYRKRGSIVALRGRVSGGAAGSIIFQLPVGFRPTVSVKVIARNSSSTGTGTGAGSFGVSNLGNVSGDGPSSNLTIPNLDISYFVD